MEIKMDIISELNGKRILIWGYGREGKATEHFLQRCVKPASVDIFEGKKEEIDEDDYDFIIKSPGIVMNEENPKYTSETELFLQQFRDRNQREKYDVCNALYCFEGMQRQTGVTAWKYWTALS